MPTFAPTAPQFTVHPPWTSNRAQYGFQRNPEIAPLTSTGGFVVMWDDSVADPDFDHPFFRRFDGDGAPLSPQIFFGNGGGTHEYGMDIAGFAGGGFRTVWINMSHRTIFGKEWDSSGQQIATFSLTPPSGFTNGFAFLTHHSIDLEPVPAGGFVLTWAHQDDRIYWQQFGATNQPVTQIFSYDPADNRIPYQLRAEAFETGGFAIVHAERTRNRDDFPELLLVKTYDPNWNLLSTTLLANRVASSLETFATTILADDLLVVAWTMPTGVVAQLFDAAGQKVRAQIQVSSDIAKSVDVEAHPSGGFVVVWTDPSDSVDTSGSSVKAQAFTSSGVKDGLQILVNNATQGDQQDPDIAILTNGDVVVTWTTQEPGTPNGVTDVAARIFHDASGPSTFVDGTSGDDRMEGTIRNEIFSGRAGHDLIFAGAGSDGLYGGEGNDYLDAGPGFSGRDFLAGGPGDDYMLVDSLDGVSENSGEGFDRVLALTSYALNSGAEIEMIIAHSEQAVYLIGNEFDQELIGNSGNNYLDGDGGRDRLFGAGGDDTYLVDSVDAVREDVGGGHDNVAARDSYALAELQEIEVLSTSDHQGIAAINLVGNEFGQTIFGNAGANYLDGGGGADRLQGLGGDDHLMVDADDVVIEAAGGGYDNVAARTSFRLNSGAHVEVLSTSDHSGSAAIDLTGNELGQTIIGNAGANVLNGGLGRDALLGLGGADTFAFTTATVNDNIDVIHDFVSGDDRIALDNAIFTGLAEGPISADAFRIGTAAHDADDRIIYDPATGILLFDPDGTGSAVAQHFVSLMPGTPIVASDFLVI